MAPSPGDFASEVVAIAAGAQIVGGWCGTTPDHVAALRTALDGQSDPIAAA